MDQGTDTTPTQDLSAFRAAAVEWLDDHASRLSARQPGATLDDEIQRSRRNQQLLWDAGWLRHGWPESVGGLGGPAILRAAITEEAARRELFVDSFFAITEVLGPTVLTAAPHLADDVSRFLRGDEGWSQGFSEPDAGSDLASLRCRAVDDGDDWVVSGSKIWSSYAQYTHKMVLLARTGTEASRHRGITAMLVDMDAPGLSVQALPGINDQDEFTQTVFDEVRVPKSRLIGEVGGGWAIAMDILRSERGGIFWMFAAKLLAELASLLEEAALDREDDDGIGHAFTSLAGLRARSWTTQHRLNHGLLETPETSIDKMLMATSEQELYDLLQASAGPGFAFGDDDADRASRSSYMYSRAATIYGGTIEIQRNIVADQLIGLRGLG